MNWKELYQKSPHPFKIITLEKEYNLPSIPIEFFASGTQGNEKLKQIKTPNLDVNIRKNNREIIVELLNYSVPFINIISEKVKEKITSFSDYIDFWAIDFNYKDNIFKNRWYSFRTPKDRKLTLKSTPYLYKKSGVFNLSVKLIDIFGIETVESFNVKII